MVSNASSDGFNVPSDDANFISDDFLEMDASLRNCTDMPFDRPHSAAPIHSTVAGSMTAPSGRDSGANGGDFSYELFQESRATAILQSPRGSQEPSMRWRSTLQKSGSLSSLEPKSILDRKSTSWQRSSLEPVSSPFDSALVQLASTHNQEVGRLKGEISQLRDEVAALKGRWPRSRTSGAVTSIESTKRSTVGFETKEVLYDLTEDTARSESLIGTKEVLFELDEDGAVVMPEYPDADMGTSHEFMKGASNRKPEKTIEAIDLACGSQAIKHYDSEFTERPDFESRHLPPLVEKWLTIVEGVLEVARTRRIYALRDEWVKSNTFMQKMERQHGGSLDLQVLVVNRAQTRRSIALPGALSITPLSVEKGNWLLHPSSRFRLFWVALGMLLVVYDIIVLPLNVFPLPEDVAWSVIQWFAQIFWTLDIVLTFCTATYKDGDLVKEWIIVAKIYSRTWLPFDLLVVMPLWLTVVFGADEDGTRSSVLVKYVRMLRFMRLARLAKLEKYLNEVLAGSSKDGGWVEKFSNRDVGYMYVTSMHWSFSQFQGTSDIVPGQAGSPLVERCVAAFTILVSLVILSSFVSSLTNIMLRIQSVRTQMNAMDDAVRLFLSENDISWHLSLRVKKYVDWNQRLARGRESASTVLEILPKALQIDLQEETRGPLIAVHKLFATLQTAHPRVFRQICFDALNTLVPAPSEIIFNRDEVCHVMYFVTLGKYRYIEPLAHRAPSTFTPQQTNAMNAMAYSLEDEKQSFDLQGNAPDTQDHQITDLRPGAYLSEACLWTHWEHFGVLMGMKHCSHVCMEQAKFSRIAKDNPTGHASIINYARRFVGGLNRFGKKFTDLIDNKELCEELGGGEAPTGRKTETASATPRFWNRSSAN